MKNRMILLGFIAITVMIGLGFTACGDDETSVTPPAHTHSYSTTWSSNATQHWKECTGAGCDAKTETANHTLAHGLCTTCEYGTLTHTYSPTWSSNATQHWKECTVAGCNAKTETANHAPSNGLCTICGHDNHTHTYSTTWSSNATQHWKECTGAGCDAKTGTANHTLAHGLCTTCEYGTLTHTYSTAWSKNATQHWKECTVAGCDAKTETANHTLAHGLCTICEYGTLTHTYSTTWSSNATQHWKECTIAGCDAKTETANHAPSNGICTTCGYDNTPPCSHTYVYTVTSTLYPAQSIQTCSYCGETTGIARNTTIGDTGPAGGIIFYVASSGFTVQGYGSSGDNGYFAEYTAYYLEAAPENETRSRWQSSVSANNTLIDDITTWANDEAKNAGLAASIGVGRKDTQTIVNSSAFAALSDTAAQRCASKTTGGKTDWFLPSFGELNEMYKARTHLGISTEWLTVYLILWSSTQGFSGGAWSQVFNDGNTGVAPKSRDDYVRAVRAF